MANKLELTWYGKDEPIRVEPRLLIENAALSNTAFDPDTQNMLIHGDNLLALKALESKYAGQVKCIYIDPPFNTGQAFENYDDNLEMSIWLDLMRSRLQILHTLLKDDGTLFVHIDDQNLPYITILLDEIFGKQNRLYLITFKQGAATGHKAINPGCVTTTNFILIYSRNKASWNPHRVYTKRGRDDRYTKFITNISDDYRSWNIITLIEAFAQANEIDVSTARKRVKDNPILLEQFVINNAVSVIRTARPDLKSVGKEIQEMVLASKDRPSEILYLHREGNPDMYFINGERILFYKDKLKNIDGELVSAEPLTTLWDDILSNNLHKEGNVSFPKGKKPEYLIKRVLEIATDEGDLVSALKNLLISKGKISPLKEIVFIPTGGVKGIKATSAILSGVNEVKPPVLIDGDKPGVKMANELKADFYAADTDKLIMVTLLCFLFVRSDIRYACPSQTPARAVSGGSGFAL